MSGIQEIENRGRGDVQNGNDRRKEVWRVLSKISAALIAVGGGVGLAIKLGLPEGTFHWYQGLYFTVISNLMVFVFYLCILIWGRRAKYLRLKGGIVVAILVTGLTYHFILVGGNFEIYPPWTVDWLCNILVHYFIPAMVLLDWILFDCKGRLKWKDPLIWILFPCLYFTYIVGMAQVGSFLPGQVSPYPYPFIDVIALGWTAVGRNVLLMGVGFLLLGFGLFLLDLILSRFMKRIPRAISSEGGGSDEPQ